jgi:hypothetical protein
MVLAAEKDVVSPLLAVHGAVAEGVTERHQHLAISGITVVPRNPEIRAGDTESLERSVRAVRSRHEVDE